MNAIQIGNPSDQFAEIRGYFGEILEPARDQPAGIGRRVAAYLLDAALCTGALLVVGLVGALVSGALQTASGSASSVAFLIAMGIVIAVPVAYFIGIEGKTGATPGKHLLGLLVVRTDGGDIGFREAVIRNILRVVDALPALYLIGLIAVLASERNQRIGDRVAGTVVVRR